MKCWRCIICGFVYDEALGVPEEGIASGYSWDRLPYDWDCPYCGTNKDYFV